MNYESLNVLRRPLAVLLGLTATYALVHFVFNSLYDETSLMLDILGYIMAVGATFFVVLTYIHRRRSEEPNLGAACAFYAALVLAILFFGWIDSLNDYVHLSEQTTNNVWTVDVMFVVVGYTVSARLSTGSSNYTGADPPVLGLSLGKPNPRVAIILRCISDVPPYLSWARSILNK